MDLRAELNRLPLETRVLLAPTAEEPDFAGVIPAPVTAAFAILYGGIEAAMLSLVPLAQCYARPGVSGFRVGAIALGQTGALYLGANMEFGGQSLIHTLHAEQSAVVNAWLNGEQTVGSLAVTAAPCGYCRQFLFELNQASKLEIVLPDSPIRLLPGLLPDPFGPQDLGRSDRLLLPQSHAIPIRGDAVSLAAMAAANMSYAPYTNGYAGVALSFRRGTFFGPLAENAAFNPSVSPMLAALNMANLAGIRLEDVEEAVLAEVFDSPTSQEEPCRAVLQSVSKVELKVIRF